MSCAADDDENEPEALLPQLSDSTDNPAITALPGAKCPGRAVFVVGVSGLPTTLPCTYKLPWVLPSTDIVGFGSSGWVVGVTLSFRGAARGAFSRGSRGTRKRVGCAVGPAEETARGVPIAQGVE